MWYHWLLIIWLWLGSASLTIVYIYLEQARKDSFVFEALMRNPVIWAYCLLVPLFAPLLYPIASLVNWFPAIDKWLRRTNNDGQ
jgi:hypothetical protein